MASTTRQETIDLISLLQDEPHRFDFFRAMRLLEAQFREFPRWGESLTPRNEPIRFRQEPSLAFAPSTLDRFDRATAQKPGELLVNFLGLFGPNGPLPLHVTEYARDRQRNAHDVSMVAFLNIFHQRILSLFYRAWAVNQKAADFDRPDEAAFPRYLGSLYGLGTEPLRDRDAISDWSKLYYSGRLVCQTRNAEGLGAIIEDYFGMPTIIESFRGHWLELPQNCVCRLGESPDTGSLGVTTLIGARFWDCQLKFRIRLGPLSFADLSRMLPTTRSFQRLKTWVLTYLNQELFWDAQLVLKKEEVPETRLGQAGLLGWTCWIRSKPAERDAEDVVLNGS